MFRWHIAVFIGAFLNVMFYFLICFTGFAITNYVVPPGTLGIIPTPNYTNWDTAATNIQDAVDVAIHNDNTVVMVTNGNYALTNEISIRKLITVRSANGLGATFINGNYPNMTNRCVYMGYNNASLLVEGFTISNGFASSSSNGNGGGVYMINGQLRNCRVCGNNSTNFGGGIYMTNGYSMVTNCEIYGNWAAAVGGGIYAEGSNVKILNSTIHNNIVSNDVSLFGGMGGGAGVFIKSGTMQYCQVYSNACPNPYQPFAGGVYGEQGSTIRNCLIYTNTAKYGAGLYCRKTRWVENCTIAGNASSDGSGGVYIGLDSTSDRVKFQNTIIYMNYAVSSSNFSWHPSAGTNSTFTNCCFAPINYPNSAMCSGSIDGNPRYVSSQIANYRLSKWSPCINSGTNQPWMSGMPDLDGRLRIDRYSGIVDMGVYEYSPQGTIFTVR